MKLSYVCLFYIGICAACSPQDKETKVEKYALNTAESGGHTYEYVSNDPLGVRVYTLDNGLKVYLSDYKAAPRVQTYIAVKAGGKNDPAQATGLAHYLEHMMFKGTADFGTADWQKEKILLDSIEQMFEHYRTLTDEAERKAYYRKIDAVSNEASNYAIANEYDKMLSAIGAKGTNAYTTTDRTVYINDIPANQMENFLRIEGNRFQKIVNRLFHTELEAVYEEKNRSLDNDGWKVYDEMNRSLFTKHPYGTQSVIGTIDHLKNPSISEIVSYFNTYYVPNNVAICMSGDLDFDKTIQQVDKYFGEWKANEKLPHWSKVNESPISSPIVKEVIGPEAASLSLGFRFEGRSSKEYQILRLVDMLLNNSKAGLIDINLLQKQKVLDAGTYTNDMNDYTAHVLYGTPREGQRLEEVRTLLLEQVDMIKKGEFEDWLLEAVLNDLKQRHMRQMESNRSRASEMVTAFTNDMDWKTYISEMEVLESISREDVIDFVEKHYGDNYAVIYKRTGKDTTVQKVVKPEINKVALNREQKSKFYEEILDTEVEKLKPVFVDYENDLQKAKMDKGIELLYTHNKENGLFNLYYLSELGSNNDPKMKIAVEYLDYLGTEEMSNEAFKKELYKLGCDFFVSAAEDRTWIGLSGLSENMEAAVKLFEALLAKPKVDEVALKNLIDGIMKERENAKKSKNTILFSGLMNYGMYGARSPFTNVLSNSELKTLRAEDLIDIIKGFTKKEHRVMYYGPNTVEKVITVLSKNRNLPENLDPLPETMAYELQDADRSTVYWADYDMVQAEILSISKGAAYDAERVPAARLYNEYFGGSMGSIVFQEIREAQGLAYSVWAGYTGADKAKGHDYFVSYVGTQADKQEEAMLSLNQIVEDMPKSETTLNTAKEAILNKIESERIIKTGILFNYLEAEKKNLDHDIRKDVYEQVPKMDFEALEAFQEQYIKGSKYNIMVLGAKDKLDFEALKKYGPVKELSLDELFGYEQGQKVIQQQ